MPTEPPIVTPVIDDASQTEPIPEVLPEQSVTSETQEQNEFTQEPQSIEEALGSNNIPQEEPPPHARGSPSFGGKAGLPLEEATVPLPTDITDTSTTPKETPLTENSVIEDQVPEEDSTLREKLEEMPTETPIENIPVEKEKPVQTAPETIQVLGQSEEKELQKDPIPTQPELQKEQVKPEPKDSQKKLKILNNTLKIATIIGVIFIIGALVLVATPSLPYIWYRLSTQSTASETESISEPVVTEGDKSFVGVLGDTPGTEETNLPDFDASLPYYNTLIIPTIGVNGVIHEGDDPQSALEDGVWRVGDFGNPEDTATVILAAHRFGYLSWTNEFRTINSFYNLPKMKVGGKIEIVWNQRKYEYSITKAEEGTEIKDYESDLILYTCKLFNTPVRVFRYAERTN
ncbi:MAG: sortase [bacterium]